MKNKSEKEEYVDPLSKFYKFVEQEHAAGRKVEDEKSKAWISFSSAKQLAKVIKGYRLESSITTNHRR
jgi:hypothetical protein